MKKGVLINQPLSAIIAGMGHADELVVADAGLPIPAATRRIDLALTANVPLFVETLRVVLAELEVERAIVAEELAAANPAVHRAIVDLLGDVPLETVPHETFKVRTANAVAAVEAGDLAATVAQQPLLMGELGVSTALAAGLAVRRGLGTYGGILVALLGVASFYQQVIKGVVLILAIVLDLMTKQRR